MNFYMRKTRIVRNIEVGHTSSAPSVNLTTQLKFDAILKAAKEQSNRRWDLSIIEKPVDEERFSAYHLYDIENCRPYPYTSAESQFEILQVKT